ncbi:hypothetical protein HZZ13_03165 [Bradyrhizobium sp. CNPSo 4010]|uniref:Uncharacterized protein n=1 Tax=Bradyrhizobium agreste TaxID=2751811 RepID=A0ABS0PHW0_9BRAD|nr:hypothetical protein [Bradyrhizobium agreste]MBH5396793.1 hypothetical protein [Bradyrhizobium agreste]
MKNPLLITSVSILLGGASAAAAELPSFELSGFPMTRHQVGVLGATNVEEQLPGAIMTVEGMPASPHQIAVLHRRPERLPTSQKPGDAQAGLPRVMATELSR